jgi:RNA-directed DNA polymerase
LALLRKLNTSPLIRRQIEAWLKAGVREQEELFPTEEGTPQGGVLSPLLANIALHGLEQVINEAFPRKKDSPRVVRYADDLVVLHQDRAVIEKCQALLAEWLKGIGLEWKPSKTRITHTLKVDQGPVGFDFLGFEIRQHPTRNNHLGFKTIIRPSKKSVKRHSLRLAEIITHHKRAGQARLINQLNPAVLGWSNYFSRVCSKRTYSKVDKTLLNQLRRWVRSRHPKRPRRWAARQYWKREAGKWYFSPNPNDSLRLHFHSETGIKRHVKITGNRSPYDGEWVYWSTRIGHHPGVSNRVTKLLQRQKGRCQRCGLFCKDGDVLEVDHIIPREQGGEDRYYNWQVLHRHCHEEKTAEERRRCA